MDCIKGDDGTLLDNTQSVLKRWKQHFDTLLNDSDSNEVFLNKSKNEFNTEDDTNIYEFMNESIRREEIENALARMKVGKSAGMDGISAEFLKYGGIAVILWLVKLFNLCFINGCVPEDWNKSCIVPLYKGKGDVRMCGSYRGISLLSVVGKVYGKVIIERIREWTEHKVGEEQSGFRAGRGCMDQVFAVRQIVEKMLDKHKDVYFAFMDLEKAYDKIDRDALWKVLSMYGVRGKLLNAVKSFYKGSVACVRIGNSTSDCFSVNVGLRQGCVMSPWLFNVYMDGVVREVKDNTEGIGINLVDKNGVKWIMS